MVPFSAQGSNLTYSALSGSLLPYPLAQTISTSLTFNGQVAQPTPGTPQQPIYVVPLKSFDAIPAYGPQGIYSQSQSQYAQSIPITTPSIGYKQFPFLANDSNAPFTFNTALSTSTSSITTFFTEFSDNLYIVNASSMNCSNAGMSYPSLSYASTITTLIQLSGGNSNDSIHYIANPPSTLQNYSIQGSVTGFSTFTFQPQSGEDSNITLQSMQLNSSMSNVTIWMWGAGGGTWSNSSNISGGAGAYAKVTLNVQNLLSYTNADSPLGVSTLYIVVGKGGNRDNIPIDRTIGSLQLYEEPRYGGGGTSLLGNFVDGNSISLQGGGFSGIFTGSNITTAQPLLIVGGGGAAGASNLGGPGGFGVTPDPLPIQYFQFSTATFSGRFYNKLPVSQIQDVFNLSPMNNSTIQNVIDSNLTTLWDPPVTSKMNPLNYIPSPNTYGVQLQYSNAISNISKIRYYGPVKSNTSNLPTGFVLYNSLNKTQVLYSNLTIQPTDYQLVDNGSFIQQIYEFFPTAQIQPTTIRSNAWLVAGTNATSQASIQYSLDKITWVPTLNPLLTNLTSVQYISSFSKWYASGSKILVSSDGMNWTPSVVNGFTGLQFNTIAFGLIGATPTLVAGADNGSLFISTDGQTWNLSASSFSAFVRRIRFINGIFWALGGSDIIVKRSADGLTWTNVSGTGVGNSVHNDIAYGVGRYVIAMVNSQAPFYSGLIYSPDGISWSATSQINIANFSAQSVVFANNIFVAVGSTTDGTSFIKYSIDAINWNNSKFPITGDLLRTDVQYAGNHFISVGKSAAGTTLAGNQVSIITSIDGITWSYSLSGGFDPDIGAQTQGRFAGYGPVTIAPDMSQLYLEIQKTTPREPLIYEIRTYDRDTSISGNTAALIDNNVNTIFYPPEPNTIDVIQYPFTLRLPAAVSTINTLQIYSPNNASSKFTGITVGLNSSSSSIVYSDNNTIPGSSYQINFIPALQNVSTLNVNFTKITTGSIQIAGINAVYDPNITAVPKLATTIRDLDNRPPFRLIYGLSNSIDGDLSTYWYPGNFIPNTTPLRLDIGFTTVVDRINHVQIYNGPYSPASSNIISQVIIYTESNKNVLVYSNANLTFRQYSEYSVTEFDILPLIGYSNLYMELYKTTPGPPLINDIKFFNIGLISDTSTGYSAGNTLTQSRSVTSFSPYDGGGGSSNVGGNGGPIAYSGNYLTGGSPAILQSQLTISNTSDIQGGSGGGGGGYYGGGGGGVISPDQGGAGGGGAGFVFSQNSIFTIVDYGVAIPGINTTVKNYISPGESEQQELVDNNYIKASLVKYGQGGNPSINGASGGHGIVVLNYQTSQRIQPPSTSNVIPSFIDGSRLSVYQAPITYNTESRVLPFIPFLDPIQNTRYAGYNWVWYNAYLSLVGCYLTPSMTTNSQTPVKPSAWPSLTNSMFLSLSQIFTNVTTYFTTGQGASIITNAMVAMFTSFQQRFIQISYLDASYYEMTELYCILEYLSSNLTTPHVDPSNAKLDRLLGGIPRFGYWANPFFTNASYVGFDIIDGQIPVPALSTLVKSSSPVQAIYGLVLEQSLRTGAYEFKDIMAYKPTSTDSSGWQIATQFNDSYAIRSLTNNQFLALNIPVQPYTFKNAIAARLPLFKYSVYTSPANINSLSYNIPIQILNDFEGQSIYMYSFQNSAIADISTINITSIPFTSTTIQLNQQNITQQAIVKLPIIGTIVSEYQSTVVNAITSLGFNGINYSPVIKYSSNYYNTFASNPDIQNTTVGKAINDVYGNYYFTRNSGNNDIFQNTGTQLIYPQAFLNTNINFASPGYLLSQYKAGSTNPYYDFFFSKYTNIWHLAGKGSLSNIYGVRLTSPYDFNVVTNFANQLFYPTHKITLVKTGSLANPMQNTTDIQTYPSFQHTQMFFYNNYSKLLADISGQFAQESTSNFAYSDMFSGYGFNSYIYNINLAKSTDFNNANPDSFNYLAIRAYSPSETFQSLVRFYLPQRYDFGYISLKDLSNEQLIVKTATNVNPEYKAFLEVFNSAFSTNQVYGAIGVPGFSGSNISTVSFGDFLNKYNTINTVNTSNSITISTIIGQSNAAITNLITGDLKYILPPYLANRNRTTDPIEFSIQFSTCVTPSNAIIEQYGMGYNLGFELEDTPYNTVQRATSFFKIFDDYIYLRLNEEYGMNKMDISKPENFAQTLDTTAQSGLYNSKLMLNNFGSFATTFVQSPVTFNPPAGKLDKLSFSWYDANGVLLNNSDCEWSGSVQIVETVTASA